MAVFCRDITKLVSSFIIPVLFLTISSIVGPRYSKWSREIGVNICPTGFSKTAAQSPTPPNPTSIKLKSAGFS